ncbi:MAG: 50S ribosomal protein L11 [Nanoarchaeota archaeon]|nr:50S ribosomal protein L11 [Nanoarchaeota archaeon]
MIVKLLVEGGSMSPGPALAQKLGPIGINIGQVISQVNESTKDFKGTKVPVELDIDPSTKEFKIIVKSPPISELIKKELGIEKGSGDHKKLKAGNIAIEQIIKIAKTKLPEMLERNLKAAVKTTVGSCVSLGILIENKEATGICQEIEDGKYASEIEGEKIEVSPEKAEKLAKFFAVLHKKEETAIKVAEAEKEEAEKAKAAEEAKEGEEGEAKEGEEKKEETEEKSEEKLVSEEEKKE